MMKENFLKIGNPDRRISASQQKLDKKETNNSSEAKKQRLEERSKPNIFKLTPPKRVRNSKQIGNRLRDLNQNIERRPSKLCVKTPMKLRLSLQPEVLKIAQLSANNYRVQFLANLNELILNVVKELLSKELVVKNHCNHFVIKEQKLNELLEKIFCTFLSNNNIRNSQSLIFLEEKLSQILKMIDKQNNYSKVTKNKIDHRNVSISMNNSVSSCLQENQLKIRQMEEDRSLLLNEISQLASKRQSMNQHIIRIRTETESLVIDIRGYHNAFEQLAAQTSEKQQKLNEYSHMLSKAEKDYTDIRDYVEKHAKNKHVKNASEDYKKIEQDIYEYASYLQANQLATSLTYESIPLQNQSFILDSLEANIKNINASLISTDFSLEEKGKIMRDFVLKVMAEHKRKDLEYEKAIDFKTRSICKFVEMMKKWLDNWELKQEYLVGLRKQFAVDSQAFTEYLDALCGQKMCSACREENSKLIIEMRGTYLKIEENYKMGNSFYRSAFKNVQIIIQSYPFLILFFFSILLIIKRKGLKLEKSLLSFKYTEKLLYTN